MTGRKSGFGLAVFVFAIVISTAAVSLARRPSPARSPDCASERAAWELAESTLAHEVDTEGDLAAELARARDSAFASYCKCAGLTYASAPTESRAPIFTPGRRGTPPFARTPGPPVFTPPGPPPGRPPVTLPPVTRGRPSFTPPGPPFTPPGGRHTPTPTVTNTPTGTPNIQPEGHGVIH